MPNSMPEQDDLVTLKPNALVGNGRYRVGEEINRGGTAVVYEGYDNTLGMRVALKVRVRLSSRARTAFLLGARSFPRRVDQTR